MSVVAKAKRPTIKLVENDRQISSGSHLDRYWNNKGFDDLLLKIRPGANRTERLEAVMNFERMIQDYKLRGIGFGNWVTQEDRFNYQSALYFTLHDLQKLLQFPYQNIGLQESLTITFGARGIPRAAAHYEPFSDVINISRYEEGPETKSFRFLNSGGMGAFAHEYGHFLDYWFGKFAEPSTGCASLSDGHSNAGLNFKNRYTNVSSLRYKMAKLMEVIIFKNAATKQVSPFYKLLLNKTEGKSKKYFLRHSEIFARAFEVYVFYGLGKKEIKNRFMNSPKYERHVYLSEKEFLRVKPYFETLIDGFRKRLKS